MDAPNAFAVAQDEARLEVVPPRLTQRPPERDDVAMPGLIRALIVDDDERFRAALTATLATDGRFLVVGEAASGETAVGVVRSTAVDLVVLDVRMPGMGGLAASAAISDVQPDAVVVLVSTADIPAAAVTAARAGCFLSKIGLDADALADAWAIAETTRGRS